MGCVSYTYAFSPNTQAARTDLDLKYYFPTFGRFGNIWVSFLACHIFHAVYIKNLSIFVLTEKL